MSKIAIDTLIKAGWIIPVIPEGLVLTEHSLAIKDGKIFDLLPNADAQQRYQAKECIHRPGHALIPGLINAHTHAAMSLLRGLADDLPLMEWLQEHIWPAEGRWVNEAFVADGTQLAIAEMVCSGTTCFADMYFFPNMVAKYTQQAGMRACVGLILLDFPTVWASSADEYIAKGTDLHDQLHDNPLISTCFAPHAPYTVSDAPWRRIRTLADELGIPIQSHVHETATEINEALAATKQRPLQRLRHLGLLNDMFMAVHMTQLDSAEITAVAAAGSHVVHCPESNMKLASGICPVPQLLQAGINVALGTDGAASNNDLDMFGEMRSAALLAKVGSGDARALPAATVLRMATYNGAKALNLEDKIGSLQKGKLADITAVDLSAINTQPLYDPVSQLVYAAGREQVSDVWVGGRQLLREKLLTCLELPALLQRVDNWRNKIQQAT